jgi:hypothetical protein
MIRRAVLLWKRLSPLEERLLAEVRNVLPQAALAPFDAQVAAITLVQRSPPSWSEIRFYRKRRGKVDWTGIPLFPCTDEVRLAEVRFRASGRGFKSMLTSIQGRIFDFATTPGPKSVAFRQWEGEPKAVLLTDPLRAPTGNKELECLPPAWEGLLRHWCPDPHGHWRIHDESTAYRLALGDGEYLVLAEREGDEFILHRIEPPSESLFHLPHHDGEPAPLVGEPEGFIERGAQQIGVYPQPRTRGGGARGEG